ncbi:MAG: hypothetical protein ACREOG_19905, partial [Gemmatimonadaceae bacterium]
MIALPGTVGVALSDTGSDAFVRKAGRVLINTIAGALRAIRLYPPENEAVKNALDDVVAAARELTRREKELELRASVEFIFVNSTRLRLDLDNYASFSQLLALLKACGIGTVRVAEQAESRDWLVFLSLLLSLGRDEDTTLDVVLAKLEAAGIHSIDLGAPLITDDDKDFHEKAKA